MLERKEGYVKKSPQISDSVINPELLQKSVDKCQRFRSRQEIFSINNKTTQELMSQLPSGITIAATAIQNGILTEGSITLGEKINDNKYAIKSTFVGQICISAMNFLTTSGIARFDNQGTLQINQEILDQYLPKPEQTPSNQPKSCL